MLICLLTYLPPILVAAANAAKKGFVAGNVKRGEVPFVGSGIKGEWGVGNKPGAADGGINGGVCCKIFKWRLISSAQHWKTSI